jgi:hypothetical protein
MSLLTVKKSGWTSQKVFDRYSIALGIKSPWETLYREVFRYFMPDRDGWNKEKNDTPQRQGIYSSLGEECAGEFVNTMQEIMFPPNSNGLDLEAGKIFEHIEKFKVKKEVMNRELAKVNRLSNELKGLSGFDIAFSEACSDLFSGTACLMLTKGNNRSPVTVRAVPVYEFCINEGADGEVSEFYRKFSRTKTQIEAMWSDVKGLKEDNENKPIDLLEVCYLSEDTWYYELYHVGEKFRLLQRKSKMSPFQCVRWNKASGEVWGRGVGIKALNDFKTFNSMIEASLRASAFEAPMFEVTDDGTMNVAEIVLEAGATIGVPSTSTGDPRIRQIPINTRMDNTRIDMQRLEMAIRRACLADTLQSVNLN